VGNCFAKRAQRLAVTAHSIESQADIELNRGIRRPQPGGFLKGIQGFGQVSLLEIDCALPCERRSALRILGEKGQPEKKRQDASREPCEGAPADNPAVG